MGTGTFWAGRWLPRDLAGLQLEPRGCGDTVASGRSVSGGRSVPLGWGLLGAVWVVWLQARGQPGLGEHWTVSRETPGSG